MQRAESHGYGGDGSPLTGEADLLSCLISGSSSAPRERTALVDAKSGQRVSYGELWDLVSAVASGMSSLGIKNGDVVMLLMPNCVEFPVIFLGAIFAGAVVTTANPLNTLGELRKQVEDSSACMVFSSTGLAEKVNGLGLPLVLVESVDSPSTVKYVPYTRLVGTKLGGPRRWRKAAPASLSTTAAILYSSGTTGVSKGVVLSHGNLIAGVKVLREARKFQLSSDEVALGILPFFHIAGLIYEVLSSVYNGVTLVTLPRFDLLEVFETIQRFRVTFTPSVPPIIIVFIKNHALSKRYDLSSLRHVVCGAAPLGKETHEEFLRLYTHVRTFPQAYGLTESTGVGFGLSEKSLCGSAGRVMPFFEAKVVDVETARTVPPGSHGEVCLRGPAIMQGYLNNPKATSDTVDKDGWLHTGDLGYIDVEGNMFVMDRLKELIKYKGFQVAPAELEALLLSHPSIRDCAVVPFPDEESGEIPVAFVVKAPNSELCEQEIMKFVASQVAPHKRVRKVKFLDVIPKSATGKLLRRELKRFSKL